MTKLRTLAPALLVVLAPAAALADDYRFEVKGTFDRDQTDSFLSDHVDTASLFGSWYFKPVSTDGVPLSEAAFLGRASNLTAGVGYVDGFVGTELDSLAGAINVYIPNTMFFAGVAGSRSEVVYAVNSTTALKDYVTTWQGTLGVAPIDGLLITTTIPEGRYDPNFTARHVGKLPNGHFYAGSVSVVDSELDDTSFGLGFDYYLDDSTSLGASYDDFRGRWQLRGEKFFTKDWAAGASVFTDDYSSGFGINVTWRH